MASESPRAVPAPDLLDSVFRVQEVYREGEEVRYVGVPVVSRQRLVDTAWPLFRERGYRVSLTRHGRRYALVAEPAETASRGVPWTNLLLLAATVLSTLYAGASWYYADFDAGAAALLNGAPYVLAVLGVLGVHELGHYAMSRHHNVDASLPYFIPMTPPIGTMGAVIRLRGQMPSRRALFDIGVAGPIAGLLATVIVTAVGLSLPPITVPPRILDATETIEIFFGYPPLLHGIAWVLGEPLHYDDPTRAVNPVVLGGWLGMFVTFLNLLPVGQLDGGHVLRAILGPAHARLAAAVPVALFGLAGYLYAFAGVGVWVSIWVFWGVLTAVFVLLGPARPVSEAPLGRKRVVVGALTFLVGALCFTPVPIQVVP